LEASHGALDCLGSLGLESLKEAWFAWVVFPLLFSDSISGWVKMNDFLFCKKLNALLF
jgi:hypothetical protein